MAAEVISDEEWVTLVVEATMRVRRTAVIERLLLRLEALRRDGGEGATVPFVVDGVAASAKPSGRGVYLCCTLMARAVDDEEELRGLMARYLPYADHGSEVLCIDDGGRLMLAAPVGPGDDLRTALRSFCDAAVFWTGVVSGPQPAARVERMHAAIIFP